MDDLVVALQIFLKYGNPKYPTHCEHDVLQICGIEPDDVSDEDKAKLKGLGFIIGDPIGDCEVGFHSFRFGSA